MHFPQSYILISMLDQDNIMVYKNYGVQKVSLGLDVVVENILAGTVRGVCCNRFLKLWKANVEKLYRSQGAVSKACWQKQLGGNKPMS